MTWVLDCHSDILTDVRMRRERGERNVLATRHLPDWTVGTVQGAFLTVGGDIDKGPDRAKVAMHMLDMLEAEVSEADGRFILVRSAQDLAGAGDGRFRVIPHLEGAAPVGEDLWILRTFYRLGVRSIGLTWNPRNAVADGVGVTDARGLTPFGRQLVQEMERLGMVVDLSHLHERGFWDVMDMCERPPVVTHANARALCDHVRNLSDRQIEAVAARGGLIGVAFYPGFVDATAPTLARVADHVDHIRALVGIEHVALGPDFINYAEDTISERLAGAGVDYVAGAPYPAGLETTRGIPALLAELGRRGYSEHDLAALSHGNAVRVVQEIIG